MTIGPLPPWTDEQVARLNEYQSADWVHPFTCPNRDDGKHLTDVTIVVGEDTAHAFTDGSLVARNDGWHCFDCGYHQTWAHDFMFNGAPPKPKLEGQ